jgi:hypothetical protein
MPASSGAAARWPARSQIHDLSCNNVAVIRVRTTLRPQDGERWKPSPLASRMTAGWSATIPSTRAKPWPKSAAIRSDSVQARKTRLGLIDLRKGSSPHDPQETLLSACAAATLALRHRLGAAGLGAARQIPTVITAMPIATVITTATAVIAASRAAGGAERDYGPPPPPPRPPITSRAVMKKAAAAAMPPPAPSSARWPAALIGGAASRGNGGRWWAAWCWAACWAM